MPKYHIVVNEAKCAGCRACQLRCSLRHEGAFVPAKSHISIRRLVAESNEFTISFSDKCDGCGICVKYCYYGALAREREK